MPSQEFICKPTLPSLEMSQAGLEGAWSALGWWKVSQPVGVEQGGL